MEVWKDIHGYGDHYQASNLGKVRVKNRSVTKFSILCGKVVKQHYKGRELSCRPSVDGYVHVHLGVNKKKIFNSGWQAGSARICRQTT